MDLRASNTDISLDDEAKELERESARIRQELECERAAAMRGSPYTLGGGTAGKGRSASASPYRAPSPGAYRSASPAAGMLNGQSESDSSSMSPEHLNATLYKLNSSIQNAKKEKYSLNNELKLAQQTLMHSKLEIKNLEQQVKQNRAKAEDVRTELMLAEFKRDSARKELEKVLADINGKRHQLREMEEEEEREESKQRENNNQQLKAAMSEREELVAKIKALEAQVTTLQGRERERAELERQLQQTKEDLFAEQKRARTHMDTVKEELSSQNSKLEEMQKEKDKIRKDLEVKSGRVDELLSEKSKLQEKYNKLETKYKQMENDKNSIIKEKSEEYEELRKRTQEQMIQSRSNSSQETTELRQQLHEVTEQLAALHGEANKKEEVNLQLREQVLELQHQLTDDSETKQALQEEFNKNLQNIQKEKEAAMAQAHLEAEQKKVAEIEAVRQEVSQQGEQLLRQAEARLMKQIDNLQGQLATKDVEVGALIDKIRQQENSYKKQLEHVRQDTHDKLLDSMRSERTKWEADKDSEVRHLLANMREETDRTSSKLRDDLNAERDLVDHQKRQISQMNMEIEDLKEQNRVAYRERLQAVDKVKENAEMEKEKELDFIREQIEKETQRAQERLRDTIRRQEEDMSRLRAEKQEATTREQEQLAQQQQLERMLVKEVNEECRRLADVLCMMPRKVSLSLYNNWNNKDGSKGGAGYTRTALTNALQNLRATNDDVRKLVGEAKSEINTLKDAVAKGERSKKEEVELMRQKMQTEKIQALESLKDRLIKEHLEEVDKLHKSLGKDKNANRALREKDNEMREIQKNMATWKAQQTEKLAKKFQEEMNRELEKRVSGHKKCQRDWEREKAGQQREIERLTREMQNMRLVSTLRQSGAGTAGYSANTSLNSRPSSPTFAGKFQTSTQGADSGQLRQLQNQVKQLQLENSTLRRSRALSAATSVPDLSNLNGSFMDITPSSDGRKVIALESQLSQAETRSRLAEERAKKNEQLLNQKMTEMSKLQSQLTQQTKELMQLERAYSQIQNKSGSSSHNSSRVSFAR